MVPVVCGTSYKNKGVQKLLDAIVEYMPSPLDIPRNQAVPTPRPMRKRRREASDDAPFSALAFKIMTDPFVGKLSFFRVYSGTVEAGKTVYELVPRASVSASARILLMHANHREDLRYGLFRRYRRRRRP